MSELKAKAKDEPRPRRALNLCLPTALGPAACLTSPSHAAQTGPHCTKPSHAYALPPEDAAPRLAWLAILIKLSRLEPSSPITSSLRGDCLVAHRE
jgi:hypothetical protein